MNPFAYGTAEHLGYELMERFGSVSEGGGDRTAELPSFVLWHEHVKNEAGEIVPFLEAVLDRYGVEVAQFCALYLREFESMPRMTNETRERLILGLLDSE